MYVVAGSSGKLSGGALNHAAMFISLNQLGSMVVDIDATQLHAEFLNDAGQVTDSFTIDKGNGVDTTPPTLVTARAVDGTSVEVEFSEAVATPGGTRASNYSIDGGVAVSSVSLSASGRVATLTTSPLGVGVSYTVTVDDVADPAGNLIAPGSSSTAGRAQRGGKCTKHALRAR